MKKRFQFCLKSGQSLKPFYPESVQGFLIPITINELGPTHSGMSMAFDPVKFVGGGGKYNILQISPKLKMVMNSSKIKISSDQWEGITSMPRAQFFSFWRGRGFDAG